MSLGLRRGSCVKLYHKQKCGANLVYLMEVVEDPNRINDDYSTPESLYGVNALKTGTLIQKTSGKHIRNPPVTENFHISI